MNVSETIPAAKWRKRRRPSAARAEFSDELNDVWIASSVPQLPVESTKRRSSVRTDSSPPTISISHSCLLIPVAILLWWYWSKRTVQRVVRRLVTSHDHHHSTTCGVGGGGGPTLESPTSVANAREEYCTFHHHEETDPFYTWDDVMRQDEASDVNDASRNNTNHNTLRFVRWFKGKGTRNARARRRMQAATLHNLRCGGDGGDGGAGESTAHSPPSTPMLSRSASSSGSELSLMHQVCTTVTGPASLVTWQCIQNTTAGVELCAIEVTASGSNEQLLTPDSLLADDAIATRALEGK